VFAKIMDPVMPIERVTKYEDPLLDTLETRKLGEVTGGGTEMGKDKKIEWVGIDLQLADLDGAVELVRQRLRELGAPEGSVLEFKRGDQKISLPIHVYWLPTPATNAAPNYVDAPESEPARHILPEDIVQDSILLVRFSTNSFAVRFTYTEAGAKKMLAFREAHECQKVRVVVGSFETPPHEDMFQPMPPVFTNYTQWKEGWLKHRTDKFFCVSEDDAKKIVAGLKTK
jgi:hypothetical protein